MNKNEIFKHTAINNGKYFEHFGISPFSAMLYGHKPEEIVNVEIQIAEDQTRPTSEQERDDPNVDYWGWYDTKDQKFSFVWHKRFLLQMCFPYDMKWGEEKGQGKAYRVNVKQV